MLAIAVAIAALSALVVAVLGWYARERRLPPNAWAGIRTPYTYASDENWYATHFHAAPLLILGGAAAFAIGLAVLPFAIAGSLADGIAIAAIIAQGTILGVCVIAGWLYGTRMSKRQAA